MSDEMGNSLRMFSAEDWGESGHAALELYCCIIRQDGNEEDEEYLRISGIRGKQDIKPLLSGARSQCVQFGFLARGLCSWLKSLKPLSRETVYVGVTTVSQVVNLIRCDIFSDEEWRLLGYYDVWLV
jgi:hypothetical protein